MKKLVNKYTTSFISFLIPLLSLVSDSGVSKESKIVQIASPAYDFTFKKLFNKECFLMSFLNSLFYPEAKEDGLKITYDSEASIPGKKYKHIYFDISCTCEAYATSKTLQAMATKKYINLT